MAAGDSYSAVEAADSANRNAALDRGQRSFAMFLGVLQNRKANAAAEEHFMRETQLANQRMMMAQEQLDQQKLLATKGIEADAAKLDFEKTKQAFVERHAADLLLSDKAHLDLEGRKVTAMEGNNPTKERRNEFLFKQATEDADNGKFKSPDEVAKAYPEMDPVQQGAIARRSQAAYEQKATVYSYADKVAKILNHFEDLDQKIKAEDEKHYFERAKNPDYKNWLREKASLGEHVNRIRANKNFTNIVVFDSDAGKYVPVMPDPGSRASESGGAPDGEVVSDSEMDTSAAPTASAPSGAVTDPRIPLMKEFIARGMSMPEAKAAAEQQLRGSSGGRMVPQYSPILGAGVATD